VQVELVYEQSCPNIEGARRQLLRAFSQLGLSPRWQEWDTGREITPQRLRGLGSPTILVNGRDASGDWAESRGECCRVYAHDEQAGRGVPAVTDIVHALKAGRAAASRLGSWRNWRLNSSMLPAVGVAFLPKIFCPACWPAYAGLLSAMGIGFFDYTPLLLPLTAAFLVLALAGLGWRASARRGYRPLALGLLASATLLVGKFGFDSDAAMYAGLALLVGASVWNTWPKSSLDPHCSRCET
jgi:hypothetical protein